MLRNTVTVEKTIVAEGNSDIPRAHEELAQFREEAAKERKFVPGLRAKGALTQATLRYSSQLNAPPV
ncbi:MAG TPA: hypothetical protein VL360_02395 [Gammaproteobacteria bacterium]|nr:hypothetical protein [Gammaproteobacteria bacterium]